MKGSVLKDLIVYRHRDVKDKKSSKLPFLTF